MTYIKMINVPDMTKKIVIIRKPLKGHQFTFPPEYLKMQSFSLRHKMSRNSLSFFESILNECAQEASDISHVYSMQNIRK